MMKVELLYPKSDPSYLVAAAAKLCYSDKKVSELMKNLTDENIGKFVNKLSSMGHESPFEHISYTFAIEGISRTTLAQLTRHRIASYSVKSQRYVNEENFTYVTPRSIAATPAANEIFENTMKFINESYLALVKELVAQGGTPEKRALEDARYVLPNACTTNLIMTMNARSLFNFFKLRTCFRAQTEIRELANRMLRECYRISPNIFKYAGPSCYYGQCSEGEMCCGKQDEAKTIQDCNRRY